jgi:hypothetical protein
MFKFLISEIETLGNSQYVFTRTDGNRFDFYVSAPSDAFVCLSTLPDPTKIICEIHIGISNMETNLKCGGEIKVGKYFSFYLCIKFESNILSA